MRIVTRRAPLRRVVTLFALVSLLITGLPGVVGVVDAAPRAHVTVTPAGKCPWIIESLRHHGTAQQLARQLVSRMTPQELADFVVLHAKTSTENYNVGVPRLCLPALTLVDGPAGVANNATGVTQFASELAVAASFNPLLARQVGYAIGQEALSKGFGVLQAPDLNLIRSPLSGRAFETYGEDPYLASVLGVATIEGIQSTGVMAQAKHLGAYTQENARARLNQIVSSRVLNEIYNAPFRAAVTQGHVASVMCAMGSINGVNTCSSPWLYSTLRRWGFKGYVRSDYSAVTMPAPAFLAGMSLIKPASSSQILAALASGHLRMSSLRSAVRAVVTEMFAFGLMAHPRVVSSATPATSRSHTLVALRAAREGIVLLKNDAHVLPLANVGTVAVIGVDATEGIITRGGGSSGVHASSLETPYAALRKVLKHVHFTYALGSLAGLTFDPLNVNDVTAGTLPPAELPSALRVRPGTGDVAIDLGAKVTPAALTATSPGTGEGWSNWDVTFRAKRTGTYVIGLEDIGDTWLSINGHVVLADRGLHGPYPQSTAIRLVAGHNYTVLAQWFSTSAKTTPRFGIDFVQPQIDAAVAAARKAHTAVVFASNLLTEGADLPTLMLQSNLNALISAVAAVNPRTVVVLNTGGPVLMPWRDQVAGIVEAWYGGQMAGPAIAQVLAGVVDASGRLPVTMPATAAQMPAATTAQFPGIAGTVNFGGLSDLGYRWYQTNDVTPAYPFGYGLSYSTFSWSDVTMSRAGPGPGAGVNVALTVTNTGHRAGVDVVEVYVNYPTGLGEPPLQLRGIARVNLAAGASKNVTVTVPFSGFTYDNGHAMVVASGVYNVELATSSASVVASQPFVFL